MGWKLTKKNKVKRGVAKIGEIIAYLHTDENDAIVSVK